MSTFKKRLTLLLISGSSLLYAQSGTGEIKGLVKDNNYDAVPYATVKITSGGLLIGGTTTNDEGHYSYKPLNPGTYEVTISSQAHKTSRMVNVAVRPDEASYVDFKMEVNVLGDGGVVIEASYTEPLVDRSVFTAKSIRADDFKHMAIDRGDITAAITAVASDVSVDNDGEMHIRGGRGEATEYMVDGVKVLNMGGLPALSVENVSVITGGIPAQYGDLTSGVIVVTTKDYFSGLRDKRMRDQYFQEKQSRIAKEMKEKEEEAKRQKEIDEEKKKAAELKEQPQQPQQQQNNTGSTGQS